jgi:hypothetical protein
MFPSLMRLVRTQRSLSRSQTTARAARTACESLENRLMFITTTVDGTAAADIISVSVGGGDITVTVNGSTDTRSDTIFNNIEIDGLGANDTININSTGSNTVVVNAGAGNDTIKIAASTQDLDNIDDSVTVNGDADADTVYMYDGNDTSGASMVLSSGNHFQRGIVPAITANVESVVYNGSATGGNVVIDDPPTPDVSFNGIASAFSAIIVNGNGAETFSYRPSDFTNGSGSITFQSSTIDFTGCDQVDPKSMSSATLVTPNTDDSINISGTTATLFTGSSGGIGMTPMVADSCTNLTLDLATNDGGIGNDSVTGTNGLNGASLLRINAGTGNNSLTLNSGTNWNVTTALGVGGANLDVTVNTATVTFSGAQTLNRLQIDNNGTAQFTGIGLVLSTDELAVVNGTGNLNIGSNQSANSLLGGSFSVGAGRTFVKKGAGILFIAGAQTNGAGSFFDVQNGAVNFSTDCGSVSSRTLNVGCSAGTVNFVANQHLAGVSATVGTVNLLAGSNRVIFTDFVGVGGEGGAINLNNNDMIVNYTGASELGNVKSMLAGGYAGGAWNGIGINSASAAADPTHRTALGYSEASTILGPGGGVFSGQTVDSTAILIKYTWYGDANLSGDVDTVDFNNLAANFSKTSRIWDQGDFVFGFDVDTVDFNLLAANFGNTGLGPAAASASRAPAGSVVDAGQGAFSQDLIELV